MIKKAVVFVIFASLTLLATSAGAAKITEAKLEKYKTKAISALTILYTPPRDAGGRNVSTSEAKKNADFKKAVTWLNDLEKAGPVSLKKKEKVLQVPDIMNEISKYRFPKSGCFQVEVLRILRSYHKVVTAFVTQDFKKIDKVFKVLDKLAGENDRNKAREELRGISTYKGIWAEDRKKWDKLIKQWEMIVSNNDDCEE